MVCVQWHSTETHYETKQLCIGTGPMLPKVAAGRRIKGRSRFEVAIQSNSYSTNKHMQSNFSKITFIVSLLIASTQSVTIKAEKNLLAQQEELVKSVPEVDGATASATESSTASATDSAPFNLDTKSAEPVSDG